MCALPLEHEIEYPSSDGQPMAETTLHRKVMSDVIGGLERRFAEVADVWVGGNLLLYYEKGKPEKSVAPDVLLARGVDKWDRNVYLLWEEKPPALIFEITSRSTRNEDTGKKKTLYERLGVSELVLFDPYGEYLAPRLQGYRLERGRYHPIPLKSDGSLDLLTTALTVRPEGERLRLVDTVIGEKLLWTEEIEAARRVESQARRAAEDRATEEATARRMAEERAAAEETARRAAEERAAAAEERARCLAKELARLRGGAGG
jgi:Uma2 family endonuclease